MVFLRSKNSNMKNKYKVGQMFQIGDNILKLMAYSDGYYMCRFKGMYPFVCDEKELEIKFRGVY